MMSRSKLIVCYDIAEPKRLRRVFRIMRGFGDALQYSVFTCDLSAKERVLLEGALVEAINEKEDRVLIIDAGPAEGRGSAAFRLIGRQEVPEPRQAIVV
jgi:CRISPR-associated protein Cas2